VENASSEMEIIAPHRFYSGRDGWFLHLKKSVTICFFGRICFDVALTLSCPELDSNL